MNDIYAELYHLDHAKAEYTEKFNTEDKKRYDKIDNIGAIRSSFNIIYEGLEKTFDIIHEQYPFRVSYVPPIGQLVPNEEVHIGIEGYYSQDER